jgi:hypothetical protein
LAVPRWTGEVAIAQGGPRTGFPKRFAARDFSEKQSMLGFKNSVTPDEFGQGVWSYANDLIIAEATRSLGARFDKPDASKGWKAIFQASGVPLSTVRLYHLYYAHAVFQTNFKNFPLAQRQEMTRGGMVNFTTKPAAYAFEKIFNDLEATFDGHYRFDGLVEGLCNPEARPALGVLTAKYLVDGFVFPHIENRQAFLDDFVGFSSEVCSTVATVEGAIDVLLTKFHIIGLPTQG